MAINRASFANSRIKPRPPTSANFINGNFTVNASGLGTTPNGNTIVRPANPNRTFCTILNDGPVPIRWATDDRATMNIDGFELIPGASIDIEGYDTIYACGVGGAAVIQINEGTG